MKVTLIGTLPPIKGLSPYCTELLKALSYREEVEFIGFKSIYPDFLYPSGATVKDNGYKMPEISNAKIRNILTYYNPFSWIHAGLTLKGQVVHAQWWAHVLAPVYFTVLTIAKIKGKKIIITVHNIQPHEKSFINDFLNRWILKLGDSFIVHTEQNKGSLSKICNIDENKIAIIPHGVLKPVEVKGISKKEAREFLRVPQGRKVLLYFGNIRDYKGLDILLEALAQIIKERNDVVLLIAGNPWEDWHKYQRIIDENRLEKFIIKELDFIPPTKVEYYFAASDLVILPYKYFDAQSGVGALALPFKKPLVVTNIGGLPDLVKDERVIVKQNNSNDLAGKISNILKNGTLLSELEKDSEELATRYDWDEIAERTLKLYGQTDLKYYE